MIRSMSSHKHSPTNNKWSDQCQAIHILLQITNDQINNKWSDQCEAINILLQITKAIQCYDTMQGHVIHINLINYILAYTMIVLTCNSLFIHLTKYVCIFHFHYGPLLSIQEVHYYRYRYNQTSNFFAFWV